MCFFDKLPLLEKRVLFENFAGCVFLHIFLFNAGSDWKDHEYRSGNQDNYNRRGRNVQSNIRDYEVDDTRVYDYEKAQWSKINNTFWKVS